MSKNLMHWYRRTAFFFFLLVFTLCAMLVVTFLCSFVYFDIQKNRIENALFPLETPRFSDGKRDLNKNGKLDVYEDPNAPVEDRVSDLLSQMTLEEKAGLMFIDVLPIGLDGELVEGFALGNQMSAITPSTRDRVVARHMNHFNVLLGSDLPHWVQWHNQVQKLAERTRLGIPITLASDPRHAVSQNPFSSLSASLVSQWPEPIGLAATRDPALVHQFADIARQEYLALGLRLALHPMADLATEPRWPRISGTFGEDADLAAALVKAYVQGFQGPALSPTSVAAMVKHFPGGGPQEDGGEPHFAWGKKQAFPGHNFAYNLKPFAEGAFPAGVAQVMPHYGIPVGQTSEDVGAAFNRDIITGLLREKYHFDGVVCSDWGLVSDLRLFGLFSILPPRAWGVEQLTPLQRVKKLLDAGVDQIGGEHSPQWIVELVRSGAVPEGRIDQSVRRLLRDKFRLGLFDNPYLDLAHSEATVGKPEFVAAGIAAQRRSMVLLKAGNGAMSLPLAPGLKVYAEHLDKALLAKYATPVDDPAQADVALLRLTTPYVKRPGIFEGFFHDGDLDFKGEELARLLGLMRRVPTVTDIFLERPAVIPEIAAQTMALTGSFGASDQVFLDLVFGKFQPTGKLPFELPASMEAVRAQSPDVPRDAPQKLFPYGFGLGLAH